MNSSLYKYYALIGRLQKAIASAKTLNEAISNGLDIVVKECNVENLIVWYEDTKGDSILHPYYWICPLEITTLSCKGNDAAVGRAYKRQTSEFFLEYKKGDDEFSETNLISIDIKSMVVVPLSNKYDNLGCIQFFNEKHIFTQEEADVLEMFTGLIAVGIDENVKLSKPQENRNVLISARNIEKSYKNGNVITHVLKGVNLDIYEGEFVAILGESGCGKSTLLNIIGGLDKVDEGTFTFIGKEMSKANEEELTMYRRNNIGFIFQNYNLMPNLNSKQNLDLIGELVKDQLESKDLLKMVGLSEREKNYPSQLSGGEQQRVSIARSLIKKPKMIFADEPTAALDYETSITVLSSLEKVIENGTTLIMVTHNEEITKMANRVVRFRNGRVYEVVVNRHPLKATDLVW